MISLSAPAYSINTVSGQLVTLVVCGAPLASRAHEMAGALVDAGHQVSVIATRSALSWIDAGAVERVVGAPPRVDYRSPSQPKRDPLPAAVVVCPITFNSLNKVVAGISDTYALGVMCEAIGRQVPFVAVPMVNDRLWGHFAWTRNLEALTTAGISVLDVHSGQPGARSVRSGSGDAVVADFDPAWVSVAVQTAIATG